MLLGLIVILAVVGVGWLVTGHHRIGWLCLVVMFGLQLLAIMDTRDHFETTRRVQTTTAKIAPVVQVKGNPILVTATVKQGKTHYQAYTTRQSKRQVTVLNRRKRVRISQEHGTRAVQVTTNWRYHYLRSAFKWWFAGLTSEGQRQRQVVTYRLPKDWLVLTKSQLTRIDRQFNQKKTQAQLKRAVQRQVQQRLMAHPELRTRRTKVVQQAEHQVVRQFIIAQR